jgi:predicted RNA-binding protein associated with RNAse of E/G family
MGVAKLEGREVLRICAIHGETTIADVDELVAALEDAR